MLGIAAFVVAQSQQPDFVVPLQRAPILAIRANVGGQDRLFGVDTGSFDFIIKPQASPTISLPFLSSTPLTPKVQMFPSPAAGIIGLNLLKDKAIGIDSNAGAFSIWSKGNLSQDQLTYWFSHAPTMTGQAGWTDASTTSYAVVDLQDAGDGHFFVNGTMNGTPVKFGLDTDSAISAIDGSVVPTTGFLELTESNFQGLQHGWNVHIGIADTVAFGTESVIQVPIIETPKNSLTPAQGLFGFDQLENRKTIIDFPAHKMYLGSIVSAPAGQDALIGYGIHLAPYIGGHQYIGVIPDSVAAKAGLHSGDELIQVGGQPLGTENLGTTGSALPVDYTKSGLPKNLTLMVKSADGKSNTYSLTLP